jgi:hypothetical protein
MIKTEDTVLYCVELTWGEKQMHYVRVKKSDIDKFASIENELRDIVYFGSTKEQKALETFTATYCTSSSDPFSEIYPVEESDAEGFDYSGLEAEEDDEYEPEFPDVFLVPAKKKSKLVRIKIAD